MDIEQSSSSSDEEEKAAGVEFDPKNQVLVYDDIKIQFFHGPKGEKKLFHFWLHSSFINDDEPFIINKQMTEDVLKDKKHKKYDRNF